VAKKCEAVSSDGVCHGGCFGGGDGSGSGGGGGDNATKKTLQPFFEELMRIVEALKCVSHIAVTDRSARRNTGNPR